MSITLIGKSYEKILNFIDKTIYIYINSPVQKRRCTNGVYAALYTESR